MHQVSTGISLMGLSKTFEKQAVDHEPSVLSFLCNVGPTLLGPFEKAFNPDPYSTVI